MRVRGHYKVARFKSYLVAATFSAPVGEGERGCGEGGSALKVIKGHF